MGMGRMSPNEEMWLKKDSVGEEKEYLIVRW